MNILCETIRTRRRELGLTQKELAERLGISDKTVSRWESGVQLPEASLLPPLASILDVSIDALYGRDPSPVSAEAEPQPIKDERRIVLDFKIWMIAGTLSSLLGSLLYRYFGSTVFTTPRLIDADYYNTAKGATADIFAFAGIIAIFAGIFAVVIAKVRLAMQFKPAMSDAVFAENVRCTGAVVVVYAVIFIKTAPEILSFGFYVPREIFGYLFVAALTGVLLWYERQLKKRGIVCRKAVTVAALLTGGIGVGLAVASLILRDYIAVWVSVHEEGTDFSLSLAAAVMITAGELLIPAMPLILYIALLIRLKKIS